jgi:recombination protein RecA
VGAGFSRPDIPVPLLTRLLGLAREHDAAIVLLTRKRESAPSMYSLVSLRVEARWRGAAADARTSAVELSLHALKDKRRGPGWTHVESCRGPVGLR